MTRPLTIQEEALTKSLLDRVGLNKDYSKTVEVLDDGGMGTIKFVTTSFDRDRKYKSDIIQVSYKDLDDITVLITLTVDNFDDLFELEFWKTDFSPLKKYPTPQTIDFL